MTPPKNPNEVREQMQKLARGVQEELPPDWGFIIMAFPINDPLGRLNYISNGNRDAVLKLLKEFLYRNKDSGAWNKHLDTLNPNDGN
jgi:hypothetical protein